MENFSILSVLNRKQDVAGITPDNLDLLNLSEEERSCITKYRPGNSLIVYGTLAPGKPNHHRLEFLRGEWKKAVLKGGVLENSGWGAEMGYWGFVPANGDQTDIPCYVFFSDNLPDSWSFLDEFEGAEYRRILAVYELEEGQVGVGYVYAINK